MRNQNPNPTTPGIADKMRQIALENPLTLTADKTGFPMANLHGVGHFNLWPVTKVQFEQYIAETGMFPVESYQTLLALNKRIPVNTFNRKNYEHLFVTGILPAEALNFASWMGEDFDLPNEKEWHLFYQAVHNQLALRLSPYGLCDAAAMIAEKIAKFRRTPLEYTFLESGIVEWLKTGESRLDNEEYLFHGRGAPRPQFFPNVWNPPGDPVQVINSSERIYYFGFRLIKRSKRSNDYM